MTFLAKLTNVLPSFCRGMQWNSPKNAAKTGGSAGGWSPQPMAATTGAGYRPMVSFNVSSSVKYSQHAFFDC